MPFEVGLFKVGGSKHGDSIYYLLISIQRRSRGCCPKAIGADRHRFKMAARLGLMSTAKSDSICYLSCGALGPVMSYLLERPPTAFDSREGLLRAEHFQMAYVTSDADRACDLFGRLLGIRSFARLEGPTPEGGRIRAEFAWVGTLMYEIIEASGPGAEIFTRRMPAGDGFRLFHHHLGFLVPGASQFAEVLSNARAHGWDVPHTGENALTKVGFVDVPELPHYLEYLSPTPAGIDFFKSVPRT